VFVRTVPCEVLLDGKQFVFDGWKEHTVEKSQGPRGSEGVDKPRNIDEAD
jgi:hypothetical protein